MHSINIVANLFTNTTNILETNITLTVAWNKFQQPQLKTTDGIKVNVYATFGK